MTIVATTLPGGFPASVAAVIPVNQQGRIALVRQGEGEQGRQNRQRLIAWEIVLAQHLFQFLPFGVVGIVPFPLEEVWE